MKRLFILSFLVLSLITAVAQKRGDKASPERFQMEMEQYITRKAALSPKEAAKFFTVYSEMLKQQRIVHDKIKAMKKIKPQTEAECKQNIRQRDKLEIKMKEIQKEYHEKFFKILPASKVFDILKAEEKFHRQAFKKAAEKKRK